MRARRRVVGLAALIGFLACTAGSLGIAASTCCSETCEPCPVVFCKSTPVSSSPKVDIAHGLAPASFEQLRLAVVAGPAAHVTQIPKFLSHEFRRPMRN